MSVIFQDLTVLWREPSAFFANSEKVFSVFHPLVVRAVLLEFAHVERESEKSMLRDWWLQLSIVSAAVLSSHKVSYAKSNDSAKDLEAKQSWKTCQISSWFRKNKEQEENVLLLWGGCAPPAALADKKDNYQTMANDQALVVQDEETWVYPKLVDIACSDIKSFAYSSQATALLTSKDELLIQQNDLSAQMDKGDTFRKVQIGKGQTEGIIFSPQQQLLVWTAKGNAYSLSLSEYGPLQRINDKFQGQKIKQISCGKIVIFVSIIGSILNAISLALSKKGNVLSWGLLDDFGQLGRGQMPGAVLVPEGKTIVKVSCGDRHSAMVADDGTVWTFGSNQWSQLGNNEEPWKMILERLLILFLAGWKGLVNELLCCLWRESYSDSYKRWNSIFLWFWSMGTSWSHNFAHMSSLARISSFDSLEHGRIKGIAAGSNHSCFITTAGMYTVLELISQLGNGTSQPSAIPLLVKGLGSIQIEKLFCYGDVTAVIGHFKSSN
eukprot:jgi/Galph1/1430/GphlegSOOS_G126.1